ncbi:transglycosylase domain-containing protein [Blastococcus sp. BMG 814]|uniref:Transglycosylase domain-containing protein n=1 Tax=Blastococcus carthaginiensis TaxID=3050034 RepID=A0ABT9IHT9_9ACTN|nr:transglycosylase domain-containing protein [Blastococcus carthaginiensis]
MLVPSHDETSPVAPRAGSVRRPPAARTRSTGGGGGTGRPPSGGRPSGGARPPARGGTTASRGGTTASRGGSGRPSGRPASAKGKTGRSGKQRRARRLKITAAIMGGLLALMCVFVGVVYASTEVPSPDSVSTKQTTVIYYSDGVTEMARLGDENRTNVPLAEISEPAQRAVLAAENRSFYSDPGISFTGIVRAAWNNLTGGSTQGGSTITQQYVKNAFLTHDQTFSRKFQELFLAIKLDNNFSKEQILENYLNTIYYGRGAYGIEAAANTYFGIPAAELTAQQAAVLAVLIRSPSNYDPETNPEGAQDRWGLVLDAMVEEGWLTTEERAASAYPPVLPKTDSTLGMPQGPEGHIVRQVSQELQERYRYDEQQINAGGLQVTTTISKPAQDAAVAAVQEVTAPPEPQELREALVAVDPRTGGVVAYYGGENGVGTDYAQAKRQPGSSVKPYVLATALEQGIGIQARRDGSDDQEFPDRPGLPVTNSGGASCPACTLTEAITRSLNTTFYGLAYEVGPENVRDTILAATGLPDTWGGSDFFAGKTVLANSDGLTGSSIGIGEYELRPFDQAQGFATLAAGGVFRDAHFIGKVTDGEGAVLVDQTAAAGGEQVLPADVVNDVTVALKDVASYSRRALDGGREVASKTGTQGQGENNSDAWMVGYTPSIATAVWIGNDSPSDPIVDSRGRIIYGSGLPGAIWQRFMDTVLAGTPEEDLPDKALIKGDTGEGVPAPTTEAPPPVETPAAPSSPPSPSRPSFPDRNGNGVDDRTEPQFPDENNDGIDDRTQRPPFPDENNDGIDDRTQRPPFPDENNNGIDDRTEPQPDTEPGTPGPVVPPPLD